MFVQIIGKLPEVWNVMVILLYLEGIPMSYYETGRSKHFGEGVEK